MCYLRRLSRMMARRRRSREARGTPPLDPLLERHVGGSSPVCPDISLTTMQARLSWTLQPHPDLISTPDSPQEDYFPGYLTYAMLCRSSPGLSDAIQVYARVYDTGNHNILSANSLLRCSTLQRHVHAPPATRRAVYRLSTRFPCLQRQSAIRTFALCAVRRRRDLDLNPAQLSSWTPGSPRCNAPTAPRLVTTAVTTSRAFQARSRPADTLSRRAPPIPEDVHSALVPGN
ncbi:hypothetical protein OH76DRAFT_280529 [Lentinus brumalis]|uniref:Uncharacterized protein n=1 Tax=Lentinus brumalis TaxID=2498619 RepID=A0A371CKZ2_9APHY|nr:hypothetical protein OH76DRAFT_280529 [Polyporus brumalis]